MPDHYIQEKEIINILEQINKKEIDTLLCKAKQINIASRVLWQNKYIKRYILEDTNDPLLVENSNSKMQTRLWDVVASRSNNNPIEQAGWINSFTGTYFTKQEIKEWVNNTFVKLKDYLHENSSVLEIGIASGLTCCAVAPVVGQYIGIDLSNETLKRTKKTLIDNKIQNVSLKCADAMDIDNLKIKGQDVVIINSVAQYFPGYNYFVILLKKLLSCVKEQATFFIGDIIDMDRIEQLEDELAKYGKRKINRNDLCYTKAFMKELPAYIPEISALIISEKIGRIENELKKYRYDVIISIDKGKKIFVNHTKFQYAMQSNDFSIDKILSDEVN